MSSKEPIIKFSPFQALLIGEKNKVLKRQPMRNTIFVTRLNQQSKSFNLRDLFGLEKDTGRSENNDVIFKMPQRVCDFLKSRKLRNKSKNTTLKEREDILCYEFEGRKLILKENDMVKPKLKKIKLKSKKVKFKKRFKHSKTLEEKVFNKLHNCSRKNSNKNSFRQNKRKHNRARLVLKEGCINNRHLLRGQDGKFISRSEYESLKAKGINKKCLSNYVHEIFKNSLNNNENSDNFKMLFTLDNIVELESTLNQFNKTIAMLGEKSRKLSRRHSFDDFDFPKIPEEIQTSDFEDDSYLIDIIYENFPQSLKFGSTFLSDDFADALKNAEILVQEKGLKIYEKKRNGFVKNQGVRVIFNSDLPFQFHELRKLKNITPSHHPFKGIRNDFASMIDEPYTKKSHLITGKSFGSLFFRSAEGKDVFIGDLVKPFLHNYWFGSLPEI